MVKGVNKTIIEINNTESEYFDKILLFVKANYGNDKAKIDREIAKISHVLKNETLRIPLRQMQRKRKRRILLFGGVGVALAAATVLAIVLL